MRIQADLMDDEHPILGRRRLAHSQSASEMLKFQKKILTDNLPVRMIGQDARW